MIGGATRGLGGRGLAVHLNDVRLSGPLNEITMPGASRGLVSDGIEEQVAELTALVAHVKHSKPLYHAHVDPPHEWSEAKWDRYWQKFEMEFGLSKQPFSEALHQKEGRWHRHRVYSLAKRNGACIRMDHDFARREKLHRLIELEDGQTVTAGAHNFAVINALRNEGKYVVAAQLIEAGIIDGPRPRSDLTPEQRAQQERTGVERADVQSAAWKAWQASDSGPAFVAALATEGYRMAMGDKVPVVIDRTGNTHPVARLVAAASKAAGTKLKHDVVHDRLAGVTLESVDQVTKAVAIVEPVAVIAPASADADLGPSPTTGHTPQTHPTTILEDVPSAMSANMNREIAHHGPATTALDTCEIAATEAARPGVHDRAGDQERYDDDIGAADGGDGGRPQPIGQGDRTLGADRSRTETSMGRAGIHRREALKIRVRLWAQQDGWIGGLIDAARTRPGALPVEPYVTKLKAEMARQTVIINATAPSWQTYRDDPVRLQAFQTVRHIEERLHELLNPEDPPGFVGRLIHGWKIKRAQREHDIAIAICERVDAQATKAWRHDADAHEAAKAKAATIYRGIERVVSAVDGGLPRTALAIKCGQPFEDVSAAASCDWDEEDGRRRAAYDVEEARKATLEHEERVRRAAGNKRNPAKSVKDEGWEPPTPM